MSIPKNYAHSNSMRIESPEDCAGCLYLDFRISSGANIKGDTPYCKFLRTAIQPHTTCPDGPVMRIPRTNEDWVKLLQQVPTSLRSELNLAETV